MAKTESTMLALGTKATPFKLKDPMGKTVSLEDYQGMPILLVFMCNHCPYVKHIADPLAKMAKDYMDTPLKVIGINSNDFEAYPDDSPAKMTEEIKLRDYRFPYLIDDSQEVAKAYQAACTPDPYLFDSEHNLVYRGQFDSTRPSTGVATGEDIRNAIDALLAGKPLNQNQKPAIGCNIKWRS